MLMIPSDVVFSRGDHAEIAAHIVARLRGEAPFVYCDGQFYQYDEERGVFARLSPSRLSLHVQSLAGAPVENGRQRDGSPKYRPLKINRHDSTGSVSFVSEQVEDPDFFESARRGITFSASFVEVTALGITQHEHSPEHRARFAYPFLYSESAEPTRLLAFFDEVWRDDDDRQEKVALVQEYIGASLLGLATRYQRAIVCVGDGANGKGVLTTIIEAIMPEGSCAHVPPQDMHQEYRRAMLAGKLLNIVSELPETDILDSESWKAIVAGDPISAREIRKEPFDFKPIAGHIYAANRLPGTADQTGGFWRRLIVLQFNRVFRPEEQDPTLAATILREERRAIVSWALRGAQRLLAHGGYTLPASSRDALTTWQLSTDQVRAFLEERTLPLSPDDPLARGDTPQQLYASYRSWATDNGHRPLSSSKFRDRMRLLGYEAAKTTGGRRCYPLCVQFEGRF